MARGAGGEIKRKIVEAAVESIIMTDADHVQITQIAARANISTRTLHRYYPEKDALLAEAAAMFLSNVYITFARLYDSADKTGMNGLQRLLLLLRTQYDYCKENAVFAMRFVDMRMYRIQCGHGHGSWMLEGGERIRDIVISNLSDGQRDGSVRAELDASRASALVSSSFHGVMQRLTFAHRAQVSPSRMAEMSSIFDDYAEMLADYLSP